MSKQISEFESAIDISHKIPPGVWDAFEIRPLTIPLTANRIMDEHMGGCIGYMDEGVKGVWHIYNYMGDRVAVEELPLEASPIDPLDILIIGGVVIKIGRWGWLARKNGGVAIASTSAAVMQRFAGLLRAKILAPSAARLKFTETAARHMAESGRYVPIYILEGAIRLGTRKVDPQGTKGLFMYTIEMMKLRKIKVSINGRQEIRYIPQKYTLEVLLRESDMTITHFLYK